MAKHENTGACLKCLDIKNKYPGFYEPLWNWFITLQRIMPEIHISCAGRGEEEQEMFFHRGSSRAHFKQSAHNWGCALDVFFIAEGFYPKNIFPELWFDKMAKQLPNWANWYGRPGSSFFEKPHIELNGWRIKRDNTSDLILCEDKKVLT